jgi:RNA polymerase sigma factor (TIGR02999 family)
LSEAAAPELTALLTRWARGDRQAFDQLLPLVYGPLRDLARGQKRRERRGHTLQTTALVHEAYLRLVGQDHANWESRGQFYAVAAQAMRRVLVDHARRQRAGKRPPIDRDVDFEALQEIVAVDPRVDLVALDDALSDLEALDPRQARIVELKFFVGLELDEIARLLAISPSTVTRDWRVARGWLRQQLGPANPPK